MKAKKRLIIIFSFAFIAMAILGVVIFNASFAYFGGGGIVTNLDSLGIYSTSTLNQISGVNITKNDHIENLSYLKKLPNLSEIFISNQIIEDITPFNEIVSSKNIKITIIGGYTNLEGLSLTNINELSIESAFLKNVKAIENLPNLSILKLDVVSDYEDLDFSKFPNLTDLSLIGIYINDFETLFKNIPNVERLVLDNTNVVSNDLKNLPSNSVIKSLSLKDTNVISISEITKLSSLRRLVLPDNVSNPELISNLENLEYIEIHGVLDGTSYPQLVEYAQSHGISYYFPNYANLSEEDEAKFSADMEALLDSHAGDNIPSKDDTVAYIEYFLSIINETCELFHKYSLDIEADYYYYVTLDGMFAYMKKGYVLIKENDGTYNKKMTIIVLANNKLYYIFPNDDNLYEVVPYYDFATFTGSMVSFVDPYILEDHSSTIIWDLTKYELIDNVYLGNIDPNTSVEELLENLNSSYEVLILDSNSEEKTTGNIGTGDFIVILNDNQSVIKYAYAVVKGDLTGDGEANISDLTKLYYYIEDLIELEDLNLLSSELVPNGNIDIGDLTKLYYYVLNLINEL